MYSLCPENMMNCHTIPLQAKYPTIPLKCTLVVRSAFTYHNMILIINIIIMINSRLVLVLSPRVKGTSLWAVRPMLSAAAMLTEWLPTTNAVRSLITIGHSPAKETISDNIEISNFTTYRGSLSDQTGKVPFLL